MNTLAIETHALTKHFANTHAVQSLSLQVAKGAVFGLLGPNGAGKSTTFGLLCGYLRPTSGHATVLGCASEKLWKLKGRVACLPQDAALPAYVSVSQWLRHMAQLTNITSSNIQHEINRVLHAVGMQDTAHFDCQTLSHGMAKRVGIAQTLLGTPELLLLDEPTAGLDPHGNKQILDLIAAQSPACTVIVSSHNLSQIQQICTHGAILDHGSLITAGTIEQLTQQDRHLTIEIVPTNHVPLEALQMASDAIESIDMSDETAIHITYAPGSDETQITNAALKVLLEHNVSVVNIIRGTSLETTFIESTDQ